VVQLQTVTQSQNVTQYSSSYPPHLDAIQLLYLACFSFCVEYLPKLLVSFLFWQELRFVHKFHVSILLLFVEHFEAAQLN